MFSAFLAALAAPAPASLVASTNPPPAVKADSAALAEAIRLLDQEKFEEETVRSAEAAMELMLASMSSQIQRRTSEPVPEDFLEQLRQTMREHTSATLRSNMGTIKQQAAAVYAQEFTREELIRLQELHKDPVMVKARERMKVIEPKLMALGAHTMRQSEPELERKIERLVSDYLARKEKGDNSS
jgi:hypothetical protein